MNKIVKNISILLSMIIIAAFSTACGDSSSSSSNADTTSTQTIIKTFTITLHPEAAPITCENFKKLVSSGFYDGLTFHRVIDDFMAQGGDPKGNGTGDSAEKIKGEFKLNGIENSLSHKRGVVSMARPGNDMNGASCQFFICYTNDCVALDGQYAAFGEVTQGMETVDGFLNIERTMGSDKQPSSPVTPIKIISAKIITPESEKNTQIEFTVEY